MGSMQRTLLKRVLRQDAKSFPELRFSSGGKERRANIFGVLPSDMMFAPSLRRSLCALVAGAALAGAGCSYHEAKQNDNLAQAVATGERPASMAGSSTYFGGAIAATVTVGRGIGRGLPGGAKHHRPSGSDSTPASAAPFDENNQE